MLTVKELIEVLKNVDEDTKVFYESDETFYEPSCVRIDFEGDLILYNSSSEPYLGDNDTILIAKLGF
mgnify:CR=1 FL=1|jgi:hypothetical protein|nr:MAG TPA_asm: hypothetical protein [Caudoviricetes sp.]